MRSNWLTSGAVVLVAVLWGAGCGNSDGDTSSNDTTPPGPVSHVVVDIGDGSASLQWENPADDFDHVQIPALLGRGVEVINSDGLPTEMVGVYTAASVTVNGTAADPADFFEWDPTTTAMRLSLFFNNSYLSEELDAADSVVYFDAGDVFVNGTDVTLQMTDDHCTAVDPPELTFQGSWSVSGDDLIFTQQDGGDTIVLTWTRSS